MKNAALHCAAFGVGVLLAVLPTGAARSAAPCAPDNGGLMLLPGFCASVFADRVGHARHLVVTAEGTVYVNTWGSPNRRDAKTPPGGYLVALRDENRDGVADAVERFGEDSGSGAMGGTGVALFGGHLYAEESGRIVRYPLQPGGLAPQGEREVIVEHLPPERGHRAHPFVIGRGGVLYVNLGSPSNACQQKDGAAHSPGKDPCEELEAGAGLWRFDAARPGQRFEPAARYAQGLRNSVALALHPAGALFAVPHGRDELYENWPERYTLEQGGELPAEMMVRVQPSADYGWPYCYYDGMQRRYVLAPEYGGDGHRNDRCGGKPEPINVFPAHWAPNALVFYPGNAFGERYRGGAFIAFHGSWNRPEQQGYNVVFVPSDASGAPRDLSEVFADGFAGPVKDPELARHRPSGLAVGPDGALFVSDDQNGRIWRIVRH